MHGAHPANASQWSRVDVYGFKMARETYQLEISGEKNVTNSIKEIDPNSDMKAEQNVDAKDKTEDDSSDDEDTAENREHYSKIGSLWSQFRSSICSCTGKRKKHVKILLSVCLLTAYFVYFGFSMRYSFGDEGSLRLLFGTIFIMLLIFWGLFGKKLKKCATKAFPCTSCESERFKIGIRWFLYLSTAVFTIVYLAITILRHNPENAISLAGIAFFILVCFLFSRHPSFVNWHAVYWGLMLQFFLALFILRTTVGYDVISWIAKRISEFMAHIDEGCIFVFGETYKDHFFAFSILPKVIFLSAAISFLYHFGIIQGFVATFGWFLAYCLGTSPVESVNAAVNLFFGPAEAPLSVKPFLPLLTTSEMHAVMTAGFASIAGSIFGAIVSLGAPPDHLLAASVMSAPAALAMSKLVLPETRYTRVTAKDAYTVPMAKYRNFIEAISFGAVEGIRLVGSILVNQMVFVSAVAFLDTFLLWLGNRVGIEGVSFALICSYLFYPLAFLIGFPSQDLFKIGELMGIKIFANSLYGFAQFGKLVGNRAALGDYLSTYNGTWYYKNSDIFLVDTNTTLVGGVLTRRSEVMGVYAFCGLNHIGAIGVTMGTILALAPGKKRFVSKYVLRANITAHVFHHSLCCRYPFVQLGELVAMWRKCLAE